MHFIFEYVNIALAFHFRVNIAFCFVGASFGDIRPAVIFFVGFVGGLFGDIGHAVILFVSFVAASFGGIGPAVILFDGFVGASFGGIGHVIITIAILKCPFGNERVVDL